MNIVFVMTSTLVMNIVFVMTSTLVMNIVFVMTSTLVPADDTRRWHRRHAGAVSPLFPHRNDCGARGRR